MVKGFSLKTAFIGGILGWFLATLLAATAIFPIANLPQIGLFIGFIFGMFKDELKEML